MDIYLCNILGIFRAVYAIDFLRAEIRSLISLIDIEKVCLVCGGTLSWFVYGGRTYVLFLFSLTEVLGFNLFWSLS